MESNKTTFWNYLKKNKILIPVIQRDYAQGRKGKEYLRKSFLASLKQALSGTLPGGQTELKLDFVYGALEGDTLLPLDGQQRLTTLWLMHWYIALKSGHLAAAAPVLCRFSYETRISSREFCEYLSDSERFADYDPQRSITDYIKSRTWFYHQWLQDPTIVAMLRMIEGTRIDVAEVEPRKLPAANELNNLKDGLVKLFEDCTAEDYAAYWDKLTSDDVQQCPIYFYQMPLQNFGLSDDLYVKMNARGKQLTSFENFKADLIGYIRLQFRKQAEKESASDEIPEVNPWAKFLDVRAGIPIKLDTDWTDIFWKNRSSDNRIDDIFYTFINRVFWNDLFTRKEFGNHLLEVGKGRDKEGNETNTVENGNLSYSFLNQDTTAEYQGLEPYLFANGTIPPDTLENLAVIMERYAKISFPMYNAPWKDNDNDRDFEFIPRYIEDNDSGKNRQITNLTQPQRILFFAVCKYLKEGDPDEQSMNRWMRVVFNIISVKDKNNRYQLRTTQLIRTAIELLSDLDSHNIYEDFSKRNCRTEKPSEIQKRFNEEIIKARQILDGGKLSARSAVEDHEFESWEEIIIYAEKYAFFNGSIRFLFQNREGETDWSDFVKKFNRMETLFKKSVSDNVESVFNAPYTTHATLLRVFLSRITPELFGSELWWLKQYTFSNQVTSWRYYLYNDRFADAVHQFLTQEPAINALSDVDDKNSNAHMLYLLACTPLLDFTIKQLGNSWVREYHGHHAIYPSTSGVFLNAWDRDRFLSRPEVETDDRAKIPGTDLFYGSDIDFRYNGHHFRWYRDNKIYLMDDENPQEYKKDISGDSPEYIYTDIHDKLNQHDAIFEELRKICAVKTDCNDDKEFGHNS